MTKHNRLADTNADAPPASLQVEAAIIVRELSELADTLQRAGMTKPAAQARNAAKFIRKIVRAP